MKSCRVGEVVITAEGSMGRVTRVSDGIATVESIRYPVSVTRPVATLRCAPWWYGGGKRSHLAASADREEVYADE